MAVVYFLRQGPHYVALDGLELLIFVPLLPEAGTTGGLARQAWFVFLIYSVWG